VEWLKWQITCRSIMMSWTQTPVLPKGRISSSILIVIASLLLNIHCVTSHLSFPVSGDPYFLSLLHDLLISSHKQLKIWSLCLCVWLISLTDDLQKPPYVCADRDSTLWDKYPMVYVYHIYLTFHTLHDVLDFLSIVSSDPINSSYIQSSSKFYE
jgi:hypothetical protein